MATVTDNTNLPVQTFDWGTLQWLCNEQLMDGARLTLGICEILPGQHNPLHYHPNCEEVLFVTAGRGRHRLGDEVVELSSGMTLRIPAGIAHGLENMGGEPLKCVIAFSSGDRQTIFIE